MAQRSVFYQTCPICGRSLRMPVDAFGRQVTCVHCGGEFRSAQDDPTTTGSTLPVAGTSNPADRPAAIAANPLGFVAHCFPAADAQSSTVQ